MIDKFLARTSPVNLLVTGLAIGLAISPAVRRGVRGALVQATRLALDAADQAREIGQKAGAGLRGLVAEARSLPAGEKTAPAGEKLRDLEVATVAGGLAVTEKIKQVAGEVKEKWNGLVTEAKRKKEETAAAAAGDRETGTELAPAEPPGP